MEHYDVIVIGSGTGGLTIASSMALLGKKVLVLEKHPFLGGLLRSYRRQDWVFNTGLHVHQWPSIDTEKYLRIWNLLGGERVPWTAAGTHYHHGERKMQIHAHDDLRAVLTREFPEEAPLVRKYIKDVENIAHDFESFCSAMSLRGWSVGKVADFVLGRQVRKYDQISLTDYLNELGASLELRNALSFYWDNYGMPPSLSSFAAHAIYTSSLFRGGFVPGKPISQISHGFISRIRRLGGKVIGGSGVRELIVQGREIKGIRTDDGREFMASAVFSSIGAVETNNLLPIPFQLQEASAWRQVNTSFFMVNYGLRPGAENPFPIGGTWMYNTEVASTVDAPIWKDIVNDPIPYTGAFRMHDNTLQCMTVMEAGFFETFGNTQTRKRSPAYQAAMKSGKEKMDQLIAQYAPEFMQGVEFSETASPLTIRDYTFHEQGTCYGIGSPIGRYNARQLSPTTPLRGFYLCGQDLCTPGVIGAFLGSVIALSAFFRKDIVNTLLQFEKQAALHSAS